MTIFSLLFSITVAVPLDLDNGLFFFLLDQNRETMTYEETVQNWHNNINDYSLSFVFF